MSERPCRVAVYTIAKDEAHNAAEWAACTEGADHRLWLVDDTSTDGTTEAARAAGIHVVESNYARARGFRFDDARNAALMRLPVDIDLCISLDADERLDPGFVEALRALWGAAPASAKPDKVWPWFFTGTWWRCDRVHSRLGWRWTAPCHEVTVWCNESRPPRMAEPDDLLMRHQPDARVRSCYLPLLRLAVAEQPGDARMWTYLARQLWFEACEPAEIIDAIERALSLGAWPPEAAFLCRIGASAAQQLWLRRGTELAPREAESWDALSRWHADRGHWQQAADAARAGLACPQASHYLADQAARGWGLADRAARASHHAGNHDDAVALGYGAWVANPLDGELAGALRWYVDAQAIPIYVVTAQKAGERVAWTAALEAQCVSQGASFFVDDSERPLHAKWNNLLDLAEADADARGHLRWTVIVMNNDVEVRDGFVVGLAAALRSAGDIAAACPGDEPLAGWCHALRGEQGYRYDESFEWWYGDSDLLWSIEKNGDRVLNDVPVWARHIEPNTSTFSDPERIAAAMRDEQRFADKWLGGDTSGLFLARNPLLTAQADELSPATGESAQVR